MERITVVQADITTQQVGAIVNAANESLLGGGGVDGAIHRAAGPELLTACRAIGGCPTGEARITKGYKLPAPWVIHVVGPIWHGGGRMEDASLASCYRHAFALVERHAIATVAFPAISTGVYRFPLQRAARIAVFESRQFLAGNKQVSELRFVCFDAANEQAYRQALSEKTA